MIPRPVQCDEVVPPPHLNTLRFHGLCAARANDRAAFVALAPGPADAARTVAGADPDARPDPDALTPARRIRWAKLLARVFAVDALQCPDCRARMRVLAVVTDPQPIAVILSHLSLPTLPPSVAIARAPPPHDLWDHVP